MRIDTVETGSAKKPMQRSLCPRVAGRLQQHFLQAIAHTRIKVGADHLHRTRVRLGAQQLAEVAPERGRHPPLVVPVHAAHRAYVDHPLVHERRDVQLAAREHISHAVPPRHVPVAGQDLRRQPLLQQGHHRHEVGAGGRRVLQRQAMPRQVPHALDRAVVAHEKHCLVLAHAIAFGQQQGPCAAALAQRHRRARRFRDPVDPPPPQIAGHLLRIACHQDPPLPDADVVHAGHHIIQQGLQLLVMGLGIIADPAQHQHRVRRCTHRPGQQDHGQAQQSPLHCLSQTRHRLHPPWVSEQTTRKNENVVSCPCCPPAPVAPCAGCRRGCRAAGALPARSARCAGTGGAACALPIPGRGPCGNRSRPGCRQAGRRSSPSAHGWPPARGSPALPRPPAVRPAAACAFHRPAPARPRPG
ncbi:hypothetical protein G6F65_013633 [Rhizopus arrhizus]|nr:hypothetical protein G6F65_013633 [Rhizopus arrhizus]